MALADANDIRSWLEQHGLGKYANEFISQDVTPDLLPDLSDADLKELGMVSLGDRKRLLRAVLNSDAVVPGGVAARAPAAPQQPDNPAAGGGASVVSTDEGERRHATVVFSDLTGYTALNEAFDPEEVEAIMAQVKHAAIEVVERHGGRVNQFVGDEVMALFGIPMARRDDARRAVAAALDLHKAVDHIAAGLSSRLGRALSMHTGIQTGLVIARKSDSRSGDYTLTGDTVNTAARLCSLAEPGQVVVSPQTWQQVSDYFDATAGEAIEVKGKERPLVPYRIVAQRTVPRAGSRPLIGRSEEMQQFEAVLQASLERQRGRLVFVRGDPGIGKSRLVAEFLDVALERGLICHRTTVLDFGARTGHDAMRILAQSLLGLAPDADEAARAQAIADQQDASDGVAGGAPFLYDLLDVPPSAQIRSLLSAIDTAARERGALEALCYLVRREGSAAPMLLLVEDIHWADAWTLQQVAALGALTSRQALVLLVTTRFAGDPSSGEWRAALHRLPVTSIDLGPLPVEDALLLAAASASISEVLLRSCVERAEGNPLFLEQLLLNAGDEGAASLPGSIQALIQSRMDRLLPQDKNALQAAAVWGQRVPIAAIRHLLADPQYDPRMLVEQFLLRPEGNDMVFGHALFRDGAYASLLLTRRRQLHTMAAEWVGDNDVALAAEHFERAEDPRAVPAYLRASEALAAQFQYAKALHLVERGIKLAVAGDACFPLKLARWRWLLEDGRLSEALEASGSAVDAATSDRERAQALIAMAAGMRLVDRANDGLALLAEAQPLAEAAGLTLDLAQLHGLRGNLLFALGRTVECMAEHQRSLVLAREAGSAEAEVAALGGIGDAFYAQGRVRSGYEHITRCVEIAHARGFLRVEVAYLQMIGWCSFYMMDARRSIELCQRALALARRMKHRRGEMMALAQMANVDGWVRGNWRDMEKGLDSALEIVRSMGSPRFEAMNWFFRALLAARAGDTGIAREHVQRAFVTAGEHGLAFVGPQLNGLLARLATDPAERAAALERGEQLLAGGSVSHNHFVFNDCAIQASLNAGHWEGAEQYCDRLAAYTAAEPVPWADFVIGRGRALARVGRGDSGVELALVIDTLRRQASDAEFNIYLPELAAAAAKLANMAM